LKTQAEVMRDRIAELEEKLILAGETASHEGCQEEILAAQLRAESWEVTARDGEKESSRLRSQVYKMGLTIEALKSEIADYDHAKEG
jgi:phage shock protein A